jgi:hypothetical protein
MEHDGVYIPPPPGYPGAPGTVIAGGSMVIHDSQAPGYAVAGGPAVPGDVPGYAVVGGPSSSAGEPAPIGIARNAQYAGMDPRMAAVPRRPGAGPYDPSVMASSLPPPQTPMNGPGHDRPHIISHLLGLPRIGQHWQERDEKRREKHASIAYDQPNTVVTELPASAVYSKNDR